VLKPVAALSFHDVTPKVVFGGFDVLQQPRMQLAMSVKSALEIAQSFRDL
jgi:hypothetical protein